MPEKIDELMFAACGMNCMVCKEHCRPKERCCPGCSSDDDTTKSIRYGKCKIKTCVAERGLMYCFECNEFPCDFNRHLDRCCEKYNWSLIMNSCDAKDIGVDAFLKSDSDNWTCKHCGGVISFHDSECSDCHFDFCNNKQGPYAEFGIIDDFNEQKDYALALDGLSFHDCLEKYHCVAIPDVIINDWWDGLTTMKSYYHRYGEHETALSRWGVTLIPPNSLDLFIEIIGTRTSERYFSMYKAELTALINLLMQAKLENKFVIHYGV